MNERWAEAIRNTFLFENVGSHIAVTDEAVEHQAYGPGEDIFPRTRHGRYIGVLLGGRAEVRKGGNENPVIMSVLESGNVFGAAGLYAGQEFFVTDVIAVQKTEALYISRDAIDEWIEQDVQVARNFIHYLSSRIYFLNSRIEGFTSGSVERTLALYLANMAKQGELLLPYSMSRLADVLHVGRASLYRALDTLAEQGIIRRDGKAIRVLDRERLKQV